MARPIGTRPHTIPGLAGRGFGGGSPRSGPGEVAQKILRAINIQTGKVVWELPQVGAGNSWGGVRSTATGLVFFCDDSGLMMIADAKTGKPLRQYQTNQIPRASPMVYQFDGKQYFAVATGPNIVAFGLSE